VLHEHRFDLAELDPEAAHLHLVIDAAEILELSVGPVAAEIAAPVHPLSGHEGIGKKRSAVSSGRFK
jgi:hypothetical protein